MVAVCVCTCRRPEGLARLLERLALAGLGTLAPGHDVRLVVVDNAPGRPGRAPVRAAPPAARRPADVRGRARARHLHGPQPCRRHRPRSRRRPLAFIDDDDLPEPDWLVRLLERQRQTGAELVFGLASAPPDLAVPSWLHGLNDFRPRSLDPLNRYGLPAAAGSCNVLLHRRLVEALSVDGVLFLPELALTGGSDSELFVRARRQGFRTATAPLSRVVTGAEPGPADAARRAAAPLPLRHLAGGGGEPAPGRGRAAADASRRPAQTGQGRLEDPAGAGEPARARGLASPSSLARSASSRPSAAAATAITATAPAEDVRPGRRWGRAGRRCGCRSPAGGVGHEGVVDAVMVGDDEGRVVGPRGARASSGTERRPARPRMAAGLRDRRHVRVVVVDLGARAPAAAR